MMTFQKGAGDYTLTYPCRYDVLPDDIGVVNPCDGMRHGVPAPYSVCSDEYKEEVDMLVRLAMDVERNIWPDWYFDYCGISPELSPILKAVGLSESHPKGCANAVQMDQPAELWMAIINYIAAEGIKVAPDKKGIRFLDQYVSPLKPFADNLDVAMIQAFEVKYYYGIARPEEYYNAPNFAHYPEGCPHHPAYPAGHGTVGGVACRTAREEFPELEQYHNDEIFTATRQFAHFRDLARVHTRQDSRVGHMFGNGDFT